MIELNIKHRQVFAEKILDVGHIAIGALIFGQFVSEKSFRLYLAILGLGILLACYLISYLLLKGGE